MSEFGRRPELNGSGGLDLDQLDEDDNFVASTLLDQYHATLAETWIAVPGGDLLTGSPHALHWKQRSRLAINVSRAQNRCVASSALA